MKLLAQFDIALPVKLLLLGSIGDSKSRTGIKSVWLFCNILTKYFASEIASFCSGRAKWYAPINTFAFRAACTFLVKVGSM
ncbi:Uncharacterised protein [Streptococcus pneumoniae]|nr:Uncharacterised protein [Streptococcus pneumoniae]CJI88818.1 Uncharacterised protein [Streptococcus pneumoniae]